MVKTKPAEVKIRPCRPPRRCYHSQRPSNSRALLCLLALSLVLVLGIALGSSAPGLTAHITVRAEAGRVFDLAGLLTAEQLQLIEQKAQELSEQQGQECIFVTTKNTESLSSRSYAAEFYQKLYSEEISGLIVLLDLEHRQLEIVTQGSAIDILRDRDIDQVLAVGKEKAQAGEYANMALTMLAEAQAFFERGLAQTAGRVPESRAKQLQLWEAATALLAGSGAGAAFYGGKSKSYKGRKRSPRFDLLANSALSLAETEDLLLDTQVVTRALPQRQDNNKGNGGAQSTTFTHNGREHGGGGTSF